MTYPPRSHPDYIHPELIGISPVYAPSSLPPGSVPVQMPPVPPHHRTQKTDPIVFEGLDYAIFGTVLTVIVAATTWVIASSYFGAARLKEMEQKYESAVAYNEQLQALAAHQSTTIAGAKTALGCLPEEGPHGRGSRQ